MRWGGCIADISAIPSQEACTIAAAAAGGATAHRAEAPTWVVHAAAVRETRERHMLDNQKRIRENHSKGQFKYTIVQKAGHGDCTQNNLYIGSKGKMAE